MRRLSCVLTLALATLAGCKSRAPAAKQPAGHAATACVSRPTVAPASFQLFHQDYNTGILVLPDSATSDQVSALVWQLRDAAQAHTFDQLHLSQRWVDARAPKVFFHLYRGAKCATETYGKGPYPCGASYHGAGDFSFGGFSNPNATTGALVNGNGAPTPLWNPEGLECFTPS